MAKYKILGKKFQFIIYNDTDYEQVWHARLSGWLVLSVIIPIILIVFFLFFLFTAYTPLRNLIPGYPNSETRQKIIYNAEQIDSLENKIAMWEYYFNSIQAFVSGETDSIVNDNMNVDSIINTTLAEYRLPPEDVVLRSEIEQEESSRLQVVPDKKMSFDETYFYPPLKGKITAPFDATKKHFGIDIQVMTSTTVTATLDGIIVFSNWTLSDDFVVQVQHSNNLISIYKGNSAVFKNVGERVSAGEAIAVVGTTNPTKDILLHFELWNDGVAIDPTTHIQF